jgi:hypothetical protein
MDVGTLVESNRVKVDSNHEPIKFVHPPCPELKSQTFDRNIIYDWNIDGKDEIF